MDVFPEFLLRFRGELGQQSQVFGVGLPSDVRFYFRKPSRSPVEVSLKLTPHIPIVPQPVVLH